MKTHPRPSRSAARYCSALRSARASVASSASSSGHSAEHTRATLAARKDEPAIAAALKLIEQQWAT